MNESPAFRRAKILCTLGPASRDPDVFSALVEAGLDGVRVNFSHSTREQAARAVELARDAARDCGRAISVLADLQGPKIRVGTLAAPLEIQPGMTFLAHPEDEPPGPVGPAGPIPVRRPPRSSLAGPTGRGGGARSSTDRPTRRYR